MQPLVGVIMGSRSDWDTLRAAAETLEHLGIPYERRVVSAHRTPDLLFEYASSAEARGIEVIIAGATNAALLAASILGAKHPEVRLALRRYRAAQTEKVLASPDPSAPEPGPESAA